MRTRPGHSLLKIALPVFIGLPALTLQAQDEAAMIEKAQDDIRAIAEAIEFMYAEKGVLPVDLPDGETPEGRERIETVFEGAGAGTDGARTMKDVFAPLVHFGYLDSAPGDPFVPDPNPVHPEWNAYIYLDEETAIPGMDGALLYDRLLRESSAENWVLASPGPDGAFERFPSKDDIYLSRYQFVLQTRKDEYLERSLSNMRTLGEAVERLRREKGVLLVDFWDDDTHEGQMRLQTELEGAGMLPEAQRQYKEVLEPLAHFGYVSEIPGDPIADPFGGIPDGSGIRTTYLYADNDPGLTGKDYGISWIELSEGDWVLIGTAPTPAVLEQRAPGRIGSPEIFLVFTNRDLSTNVTEWTLY